MQQVVMNQQHEAERQGIYTFRLQCGNYLNISLSSIEAQCGDQVTTGKSELGHSWIMSMRCMLFVDNAIE